ncbi:sigma-70 family RNA polymerase sigma factor [uncultured Ruminococcus sp.]|uniref:sigma-70 family RNA polymerase sigma factor n=1 Tax=uncultured Ruminococcus sp. TaxID=165186 RepID=UPI0026120430|nr:sigma-70 family RNA polymerase sigma factor [uncultured Ruminococcus sp.]
MLDFDHDLNELNSKTDEELAVLGKTDKTAAAVLISRFSRLVFIKSEIFAGSETDCEDLHQEGMMSLLKAIDAFDPKKGVKFSTFAEVCIVNRMRTLSRKTVKDMTFTESIGDEAEDIISGEETPESIYFYKEFFSEMWKNICSVLSLTELNVLTLCVQGLSYRSAAEKLGMTEKAVDNAMQRARRKIRAVMHDTNEI